MSRKLDKNVFIAKKLRISQGLPLRKKWVLTAVFITVLLMSAIAATQLVNLGRANPYHHIWIYEGDVSPDSSTKPPAISILSPENDTVYGVDAVSLSINVSIGDSSTASSRVLEKIYYETDWQSNNISVYKYIWDPLVYPSAPPRKTEFSETVNLTGIPDGIHTIMVYAVESGDYVTHLGPPGSGGNALSVVYYYVNFNITGCSVVSFIIDTTPPTVSVESVENKTYYTSDLPLNFTVNESVSHIAYSLDGQANVTIAGNTTLSGLSVGTHNITIYATDRAGNVRDSETIYFSVDAPFPSTMVIAPLASVAFAGAGLLVYFQKRKR